MRDWLDVPPMFPIDEYRLFTKQVDKKSCLFMSEQERLKDKKKKMSNDQGRTQKELEKSLHEQLKLLRFYCEQYDAGNTEFVYPMGTTLRVLLKDTRNCHSLLGQMGLKKEIQFLDSAHHCKGGICCWEIMNMQNATLVDGSVYAGLVSKSIRKVGYIYLMTLKPLCRYRNAPEPRMKSFEEWYNDEVLDDTLHQMTRKNIIENIAEKEGGCHLDTNSTPEQKTFQKPEALRAVLNGEHIEFQPAPVYVSLRQIAWEVLESLKEVTKDDLSTKSQPKDYSDLESLIF